MIVWAAITLAASTVSTEASFRAGAWEGRCALAKKSKCVEFEAVYPGPVALRLKRDSSAILIAVEAEGCKSSAWRASINPAYSARTMTHLIRGHVVLALQSCKSKLPVPDLKPEDTAELLRQTEIVMN